MCKPKLRSSFTSVIPYIMLANLIQKYKQVRKRRYLRQDFNGKYAFIGLGSHSLDNLYPVLHDLGISLKYIATQTDATASLISKKWPEITGTTDLTQVWEDKEVLGVFIAARPSAHFELAQNAIKAGKHVFVEKPPCFSLKELEYLIELLKKSDKQCLVGLQKRYSPAVRQLKKQMGSDLHHYSLRYHTGAYPEGDPLWDLFIHPLDLVNFLFGSAQIISQQLRKQQGKQSYLLHLKHEDGLIGSLELSTAYDWNVAGEELTITGSRGIFFLQDAQQLFHFPPNREILGIPINKVLSLPLRKTIPTQQNTFIPLRQNNPVFLAGYYSEVENFVRMVENKGGKNHSSPKDLINTFSMLEELANQQINKSAN